MAASLITGPTVEPVTLAEAKAHLRITGAEHDAQLAAYIISARYFVENATRRALITQTWDFTWDWDWPAELIIPLQPLASVTSITYVPDAGGSATLASTEYQVVTGEEFGRVVPAYNVSWPAVRQQPNTVTVRAVVGHGETGGTVPPPLRAALLLQLEILHDRDPLARETLERARDDLLIPYRVVRL